MVTILIHLPVNNKSPDIFGGFSYSHSTVPGGLEVMS